MKKLKHLIFTLIYLAICYLSAHMGHAFEALQGKELTTAEMLDTALAYFMTNIEQNPAAPISTLFSISSLTFLSLLLANIAILIESVHNYIVM